MYHQGLCHVDLWAVRALYDKTCVHTARAVYQKTDCGVEQGYAYHRLTAYGLFDHRRGTTANTCLASDEHEKIKSVKAGHLLHSSSHVEQTRMEDLLSIRYSPDATANTWQGPRFVRITDSTCIL